MAQNNRNQSVDIAKSIAIILMVVGHAPNLNEVLRNFIYSFHMPLFFILSGYFYRRKDIKKLAKSNAIKLVIPYFVVSFIGIALLVFSPNFKNNVCEKVVAIIMSNGVQWFGNWVPQNGPLWFLLALFWCCLFYQYFDRYSKHTVLWTCILSYVAFFIGKHLTNIPLGILSGFCVLPFYAIGARWNELKVFKWNKVAFNLMGGVIWFACIAFAHLNIANFDCDYFPLPIFASVYATFILLQIADCITLVIKDFLSPIGKHSLLVLLYHVVGFYVWNLLQNNISELNKYSQDCLVFLLFHLLFVTLMTIIHLKFKSLCKNTIIS